MMTSRIGTLNSPFVSVPTTSMPCLFGGCLRGLPRFSFHLLVQNKTYNVTVRNAQILNKSLLTQNTNVANIRAYTGLLGRQIVLDTKPCTRLSLSQVAMSQAFDYLALHLRKFYQ